MLKLLYNKNSILGRLYHYFSIYFKEYSAPTAESFSLLLLSILVLESEDSLRFLYRHFLFQFTEKSLNAFDYLCSYAKVDYSSFMNTTVKIALSLISNTLRSQPLLLCINDTMIAKYGTKFEDVSKLFDHAAHHDSYYLMDIVLSVYSFVFLYGKTEKFITFRFLWSIVCGRKRLLSWLLLPKW